MLYRGLWPRGDGDVSVTATELPFAAEHYREFPELQAFETILLAYRGSIAHGTYEPNTDPRSIDDIDLIGISVPSLDHYFGLRQFGSKGTKEIKRGEWDVVLYEARKAMEAE